MSFSIKVIENNKITEKFLDKLKQFQIRRVLEKYGQIGVNALSSATPTATGLTASSWYYEISGNNESYKISWCNSNENKGVNIAVILQYGHGTGTGGYVSGRDYINPAMKPIFDSIVDEAWKELTKI